jgi:hypothetical protein
MEAGMCASLLTTFGWPAQSERADSTTWFSDTILAIGMNTDVIIAAQNNAEWWRGWMGIEPTQDALAAPRKRF